MERHAARVVSLAASNTEIVCALGFEDQLVGRSHECDYPPSVKRLPQLTAPKLNVAATSGEIDRQVKTLVQEALSVYRVDAAALERLQPTHIITQTQCEVCAVSLKDVEAAVCEIVSTRPQIVALEPNALEDVWRDIRRVALARAAALVDALRARMARVRERVAGRPPVPTYWEWWPRPPITAGGTSWITEMLELAGGRNVFADLPAESRAVTAAEVAERAPGAAVLCWCGARKRPDPRLLATRPGWELLPAVRAGRLHAVLEPHFGRPGPRLAEGVELLAALLHPEAEPARA